AIAVQEAIRDEGLLANVRAMGGLLEKGLRGRLGQHPLVGDLRGRGLFWAIELVRDRDDRQPCDPALAVNERIKREAFARGLACYPMGGTIDGRLGDHVILAPPYVASERDIEAIVERFNAATRAALASVT
ncbi:MAG: aminotransferase class III-fold pyridoxal phosphate-dependent enzyme, partial [Alphaproteobacteria bacterium]